MLLVLLLAGGALVQACSNQTSGGGPSFPSGTTGHADNPSQITVRVAINANSIEFGRRAGVTVLVTNQNGRPLEGRHVQLSTTVGRLDTVDGFTDADGKFVSFLLITALDAANVAGVTQAVVTAFVDGATGSAVVNFGPITATLSITPTSVTLNLTSVGGVCHGSLHFQIAGGTPPYHTSTLLAGQSSVSSGGDYSITVNAGQSASDTVTVTDSLGATANASVSVNCT
jgi:hypothetical protein